MDLKNGRKESVNVVVTDQLPKSNDDKVKVSCSMILIVTLFATSFSFTITGSINW